MSFILRCRPGLSIALEWVGPYNDRIFGFHQVAKYYYYPGWHEPGSVLEFIINKDSLAALPLDLQAIVRQAARASSQDMLDEYTGRNNESLRELIEDHGVEMRRFPDDVLKALWMGTQEAMQKLVAQDPMAAKVYASYLQRFIKAYATIITFQSRLILTCATWCSKMRITKP